MLLHNRRRFLSRGIALIAIATGSLASMIRKALAATDPRSAFATTQIDDVLLYYFETIVAEDDASIVITAPIRTQNKKLVPFKIEAPNAEKIVLVSDANPEPLIMVMEQVGGSQGTMVGRMRLQQTGVLTCYVLRDEKVRRASLKIAVSGHW